MLFVSCVISLALCSCVTHIPEWNLQYICMIFSLRKYWNWIMSRLRSMSADFLIHLPAGGLGGVWCGRVGEEGKEDVWSYTCVTWVKLDLGIWAQDSPAPPRLVQVWTVATRRRGGARDCMNVKSDPSLMADCGKGFHGNLIALTAEDDEQDSDQK